MGVQHVAAWPSIQVFADGGRVIVKKGEPIPENSDVDVDLLRRCGAVVLVVVDDVVTSAPAPGEDDTDGDKPSSIKAILADVDGDPVKAQAALDAELATDAPRVTLVSKLEAIVGGDES